MNKYFENRALAAEETKWWTTATSQDFWKFADKVQDETLDEARDYLPLGAIRSIKKRYSDHKLFTADCDVMRQRLF